MPEEKHHSVSNAINDIQLLFTEKRTSLALMRTGIAVLALPLSVLSLLIATSKYYEAVDVLTFLIPDTIGYASFFSGCFRIVSDKSLHTAFAS